MAWRALASYRNREQPSLRIIFGREVQEKVERFLASAVAGFNRATHDHCGSLDRVPWMTLRMITTGRKLRVECDVAMYHMSNHGNRRKPSFWMMKTASTSSCHRMVVERLRRFVARLQPHYLLQSSLGQASGYPLG